MNGILLFLDDLSTFYYVSGMNLPFSLCGVFVPGRAHVTSLLQCIRYSTSLRITAVPILKDTL